MSTHDPEHVEFDFSIFHPLDHQPWDITYCQSFYGGIRHHLSLEWDFRYGLYFRQWWHRQTQCRFGRHDMTPYWRGRRFLSDPKSAEVSGYVCSNCIYREDPH